MKARPLAPPGIRNDRAQNYACLSSFNNQLTPPPAGNTTIVGSFPCVEILNIENMLGTHIEVKTIPIRPK